MSGAPDRNPLIRAFERARAEGDAGAMAQAATSLLAQHRFGTPLGRTPAFLHEAYLLSAGTPRVRLAVALARCWAYGGEPDRAAPFAAEAVAHAEHTGDSELLAEALDADLLVHWGPDHLAERVAITARLENTVAHLDDVGARLSSHLWRLTTAVEGLDLVTILRQLRALDALAEESGSARARFFAVSRRGMHALMAGDLAAARAALGATVTAGQEAGEADTEALQHQLAAGIARQTGDLRELAAEAAAFEEFGTAQGVPSITAEGALLWLEAGAPGRAGALLNQLGAPDFSRIPRDVDWLLTLALLCQVAAGTGQAAAAEQALGLLRPYAGRAVVNAGAVTFHGVVDEHLLRACLLLGQTSQAEAFRASAAACYERLGAHWWLTRLRATGPGEAVPRAPRPSEALPTAQPQVAYLVPGPDGVWTVGSGDRPLPLREMKGFRHLRLLLTRPGTPVGALELASIAAGHAAVPDSGLGPAIDAQAVAAYRRRITELDEDLAQARSWADPEQIAALTRERELLLEEIGSATGLLGRPRQLGAPSERARVAVQKSIAAGVRRISAADPWLGRLLQDTVRTGIRCCYEPDPARAVRWVLDP